LPVIHSAPDLLKLNRMVLQKL